MAASGDNYLQIIARFDPSQVKAGADAAAASVQSSTERMKTNFKTVGPEVEAQFQAMQSEIDVLQAKITQLEEKLAHAGKRTVSEMTEARHAIHGVGEEIGIHVPRFVQSYLASLEPIQGAMAAAFSIVAIVGVIMVVGELAKKFGEAVDALRGWGEEARKQYAENIDALRKLQVEHLKSREAVRLYASEGLSGQAKLAAQWKAQQENIKDVAGVAASFTRSIRQNEDEVKNLTTGWNLWKTAATGWVDGTDRDIKQLNDDIQKQKGIVSELVEQMRKAREEDEAHHKEQLRQQGNADFLALEGAKIVATKTRVDAQLSFEEQAAKASYQMGLSTLSEEFDAFRANENKKYDALVASLNARKKLAEQEQSLTGVSAAPKITELNAQLEAAYQAHNTKLNELGLQEFNEATALNQQIALAKINNTKQAADQQYQIEVDSIKRRRELHQISIEQETQDLKTAETKDYEAKKLAFEDHIALLKENEQKNKAQVVQLQGELERLEREHQQKLTDIDLAGQRQRQEHEAQTLSVQAQALERSTNLQLDLAQRLNTMRLTQAQESTLQWQRNEANAIDQWYQNQRQGFERVLQAMRQLHLEETREYQATLEKEHQLDLQYQQKKLQLDQQMAQKEEQMNKRISSEFSQNLIAMMRGQQSFVKSAENIWNNMVASFISNVVQRMVAQWGLGHVAMEIEDKIFSALHLTTQTAISAADKATMASNNAKNVGEAESAAGLAAANTLAWWSGVNPIVAPAMAAAQLAIGQGYAAISAYAGGGIVAGDEIAQLHKHEMVLPAHIASWVLNAAGGGSRAPISARFQSTFHLHGPNALQQSRSELTKMVRTAARMGGNG